MDDKSTINELNKQFISLYDAGDFDSLALMFANDAMVFLPKSDIIQGRDFITRAFRYMKRNVKKILNETKEMTIYGDVAVEVGYYQHFDAERNQLDNGKFLVVWRKYDGGWLIEKDALSTNRA